MKHGTATDLSKAVGPRMNPEFVLDIDVVLLNVLMECALDEPKVVAHPWFINIEEVVSRRICDE
jgi:hypothetical protein